MNAPEQWGIGEVELDLQRQFRINRLQSNAVRGLQLLRFLDRRALQSLNLTEPQQERFNEVLRGIDRRFSEVMARRG